MMRFGYLSANTASGIRPDVLAAALEQHGFDSIWLPEHSHIPTSRISPYGDGYSELPDAYHHMMDPFVSLAQAARATTTLRLYTGVCLVLEHDLLDLACTTATLDVLSGGRLTLGVGPGWNAEQFADHRPAVPFRLRYSAMAERIAALRSAWGPDPASFAGRFDAFSPSWVNPKPHQDSIPIALSCAGPAGLQHVAASADEWCPLDLTLRDSEGRPSLRDGMKRFHAALEDAGRDPSSVPVTICAMRPVTIPMLEECCALGVHRIVIFPTRMDRHSADETLRHLAALAPVLGRFRDSSSACPPAPEELKA